MRSVTTILPSTTRLAPIPRPATRALATVLLAAMLVTSTDARADNAPGLEEEALAQLATEALSRGVTGPGSQESRAALIALGVAGLCLGPATGPRTRHARSTMPGVAHRLAWPMAGAALGSLVACDGPCGSRHVTAGPSALSARPGSTGPSGRTRRLHMERSTSAPFHIDLNSDRWSLMYQNITGLDDLDRIDEDLARACFPVKDAATGGDR